MFMPQNFLMCLKIMLLILKMLKDHKNENQISKLQWFGTKGTGGPKELRVFGLTMPHTGTEEHGVCQCSLWPFLINAFKVVSFFLLKKLQEESVSYILWYPRIRKAQC